MGRAIALARRRAGSCPRRRRLGTATRRGPDVHLPCAPQPSPLCPAGRPAEIPPCSQRVGCSQLDAALHNVLKTDCCTKPLLLKWQMASRLQESNHAAQDHPCCKLCSTCVCNAELLS